MTTLHSWRLVLVGFGTVGRGFAERLAASRERLAGLGCEASLRAVIDPEVGSVWSPEGLDPGRLVELADAGEPLSGCAGARPAPGALDAIRDIDADVLVEVTTTHLGDGEPGLGHVRAALDAGRHVITTNKGPIALAWDELEAVAAGRGVELRFEGTVLSGTPLLALRDGGLATAGIRGIRGILNGTCNHVLSAMERGGSYAEALAAAQAEGFAEADPAADVEGWDAAAKVVILARHFLDASIPLAAVERTGIRDLGPTDVAAATAAGGHLRLVGELVPAGDGWTARVAPRRLTPDDPLAAATGATNVVTFETDVLGRITVGGPGAGRRETGHAVLADLLAIHRRAARA